MKPIILLIFNSLFSKIYNANPLTRTEIIKEYIFTVWTSCNFNKFDEKILEQENIIANPINIRYSLEVIFFKSLSIFFLELVEL